MSDTDIENTIKTYTLLKQKIHNKELDNDILYNKNLLINYTKNFYFFSNNIVPSKNINMDILLRNIIDEIEFIFLEKDTNIWNMGDFAKDIYIIFLGQVNIFKPSEKKENKKSILQLDTVLGKGYIIGSECLKYNSDIKRTYLPKTKTHCILGKINTKDFIKMYKPILSEENNIISNFLADINIFSSEFNEKFQRTMTLIYYKKDEYIFKQGDLYETFYLVFKGNIRLFANTKKTVKSKVEYDFLKGKTITERFTSSRQFEIKGSYNELIKYNLIDVGRGDFIGGIEYFDDFSNYRYSAKCITNVVLLKIDKDYFNSILNIREKKLFNDKIEKQKEFISQRIKDIKSGKDLLKLNDYILSKNKFMRAFLQSNPLSKKTEEKLDSYINCYAEPIKIKYSNKNIKTLNTTKNLLPKYIKEYKNNKIKKNKWKKPHLKIKDFITNIQYEKKVKLENIFPIIISEEIVPKHNKEIFQQKNANDKIDKQVNTEPFFGKRRTKKFKSFSSRNILFSNNLKNNYENLINNKKIDNKLFFELRNSSDKKGFSLGRNNVRYNSYRK